MLPTALPLPCRRRDKIPSFLLQLLSSKEAQDVAHSSAADCLPSSSASSAATAEKQAEALLAHSAAVAKAVGLQDSALLAAVEGVGEAEAAMERMRGDRQLAAEMFKQSAGANFVVMNGRVSGEDPFALFTSNAVLSLGTGFIRLGGW